MAALNGDAVAEPSGLRVFVGPDSEIHLADALSSHLLKGAKHAAGPYGRLQLFIGHLEVAAVAELEEGLNPDLFKNINPKALIAGIRFVI